MFERIGKYTVVLAVLSLAASPAMAMAMVEPVNPIVDKWAPQGSSSAEVNFYEILNHYYAAGSGVTLTSSADLSGAIVEDDEVFYDLAGSTVFAQAKFAGNNPQEMGVYSIADGTLSDPLITVQSDAYPGGYVDQALADGLSGTFVGQIPDSPNPFGFYLESSNKYLWYSEAGKNVDPGEAPVDHMVMVDLGSLYGGSFANTYVIGWEDMEDLDWDFNDLVVEFAVVPEPATMALLGLGIAGIAVRQARRKK